MTSEGRWWAPADGGNVGPDAFDITLLEQGKDPRYDLGATVLAIHRSGAAACEAVAGEPMPDLVRLAGALVAVRGALADPVVDSVSKSLGDESYAGLLARDLFDDAEQGAVTVVQAAIAKGVAPPFAVQRAGYVYGVPREEMGRYLALATDPKAHPVALVDLADRTLFAYVEKVLAAETEDLLEEVSKAPTRDAPMLRGVELEEFNREHPHDPATGEFVPKTQEGGSDLSRKLQAKLGLASLDPPVGEAGAVLEVPVEAPVKPVLRRRTRPQRAQRRSRRNYATQAEASTATRAPITRGKIVRGKINRGGVVGRGSLERAANWERQVPQRGAVTPQPKVANEAYSKINMTLSHFLDGRTAAQFIGHIRKQNKRFKMRDLEDHIGERPIDSNSKQEWEALVEEAAQQAYNFNTPAPALAPSVIELDVHQMYLDTASPKQRREKVNEIIEEYLGESYVDDYGEQQRRAPDPVMRANISVVQEAGTGRWILVDDENAAKRATSMPTIYEILIQNPRAADVGGNRPSYELDPDAVYEAVNLTDYGVEMTYDPENMIWHKQLIVREVEDGDVDKALAPSNKVEFQREHPQSPETGRFVPKHEAVSTIAPSALAARLRTRLGVSETSEATLVPTRAEPLQPRRQRRERRNRLSRPDVSAPTAAQTITRRELKRAAITRTPVQRARLARLATALNDTAVPEPELRFKPRLLDDGEYHVFSRATLDRLLAKDDYSIFNLVGPDRVVPVQRGLMNHLYGMRPDDGLEAYDSLYKTARRHMANLIPRALDEEWEDPLPGTESYDEFVRKTASLFARDPDLMAVEFEESSAGMITPYLTRGPGAEFFIVDVNVDQHIEHAQLRYVDTITAQQLRQQNSLYLRDKVPWNAKIHWVVLDRPSWVD